MNEKDSNSILFYDEVDDISDETFSKASVLGTNGKDTIHMIYGSNHSNYFYDLFMHTHSDKMPCIIDEDSP